MPEYLVSPCLFDRFYFRILGFRFHSFIHDHTSQLLVAFRVRISNSILYFFLWIDTLLLNTLYYLTGAYTCVSYQDFGPIARELLEILGILVLHHISHLFFFWLTVFFLSFVLSDSWSFVLIAVHDTGEQIIKTNGE